MVLSIKPAGQYNKKKEKIKEKNDGGCNLSVNKGKLKEMSS
jgi:hypothetical protein